MSVYICTYIHTNTNTCTHICTYIYMHTHTYIFIHMCVHTYCQVGGKVMLTMAPELAYGPAGVGPIPGNIHCDKCILV